MDRSGRNLRPCCGFIVSFPLDLIALCCLLWLKKSAAAGIELLLLQLRRIEAVDVGPELDDFAEEIGGFAFPVAHCTGRVGVAGGELCLLPSVQVHAPVQLGKANVRNLGMGIGIWDSGLTASNMGPRSSLCFCSSSSIFFT